MDFGRAFTYPFEDDEWSTKLVITAIIGLIPIVNLAVLGWAMDLIKNMLNGVQKPMPDWNDLGSQFGQRWVAGLIAALAFFVYYLPWIIVETILNSIFSGIFFRGDDFGFAAATGGVVLGCGLGLLGAVYAGVVWLPFSVGLMRYASTRDFNHFFQFPRNFALVREHFSILLILAIYVFLARVVLGILAIIPCIGWLLALFFGTAITAIVLGHLVGQAAVEISARTRGSAA